MRSIKRSVCDFDVRNGNYYPSGEVLYIKILNSSSMGTIFYEVSNRGVAVIFKNMFIDLITSLGLSKDY
jgi:hypothetical protein